MIFKFIVVLLVSVVFVGSASLLWPKFTKRPEPAPLNTVREKLIDTDVGKAAAEILGVTQETDGEPINVASAASVLAQTAIASVEKQTQIIIIQQAVEQIKKQMDTLPEEEKKQIQDVICKP